MLFDALFLTLFFLTWALLGMLSWIVLSLRRRAHGALWALPFALLAAMGGGAIVPALSLDNGIGIGVSMITAPLFGAGGAALAFHVWDGFALGERFARFAIPELPARVPPRVIRGTRQELLRPQKAASGLRGAGEQERGSIDSPAHPQPVSGHDAPVPERQRRD